MEERKRTLGLWILGGCLLAALLSGRVDLWSSSVSPVSRNPQGTVAQAQEAEGLQAAFVRIGQQVGPAVVSISTEQIEQVRQYFRVHPFFGPGGGDPFEDFFRQFQGDVPQQEFRRFGLGSGVIIDAQGLILTNEHVVADAEKIPVGGIGARAGEEAVLDHQLVAT